MARGTIHDGTAILDWLTFFDPENPEQMYRVNIAFITSGYRCLFGQGCPGLLNRGARYDTGCCERGVTFTSDEDLANITNSVSQLTEEDCDHIDYVREKGWFLKGPKGKPYKTKKLGDACIFANREGGKAGKPGCAFHHLAIRTGQNMIDLKPEICWTNPMRFDNSWENDHDVLTITAFDSDDWGGTDDEEEPSGVGHMGYWCIDYPDAYSDAEPVWKTQHAELTKMMGKSGYDELVRIIKERGWDKQRPPSRMPGEVRNDGRPMLPLLIKERG